MNRPLRKCCTFLALVLIPLGALLLARPALAATITVDTSIDEDTDNADCSLREAIIAANTDAAYRGCTAGSGSDTITMTVSSYVLTSTLQQLPDVSTTMTIDGNGARVAADASPETATYRIFEVVGSGILTLTHLSLENGNCVNALSCGAHTDPDQYKGRGGAVLTFGKLTLQQTDVSNNIAAGSGGGIFVAQGTLTVESSAFISNSTGSDGGGIAGSATINITDTLFMSNSVPNSGGGISTSGGTLTVRNSVFMSNTVGGGGGGISGNSRLQVQGSTFLGNFADDGGAIYSAGGDSSYIVNSTITSNTATSRGGGIYNYDDLRLINSTVVSNSAQTGGAFYSNPYQNENDSIFAVVSISNTILAHSVGSTDCFNFKNGFKIPITGENNLIESDTISPTLDNACGTTNPITGTNPLLGKLTEATPSFPPFYPLLSGSPAIDAGSDSVCAAAPVNNTAQNGVTRPTGAHCEIGAVEVPTVKATTLELIATPNPSTVGQTVTFTATVSAEDATPTGNVIFSENDTLLQSVALSNGKAVFTKSDLGTGSHEIKATYSANSNFTGSTATVTQVVNAAQGGKTAVTLTIEVTQVGDTVTITVTIQVPASVLAVGDTAVNTVDATPTGTVTICARTGSAEAPCNTIGSGSPTDSVFELTTKTLPSGINFFRGDYGGDDDFEAASSPQVSFNVSAGTNDVELFVPLVVNKPKPKK